MFKGTDLAWLGLLTQSPVIQYGSVQSPSSDCSYKGRLQSRGVTEILHYPVPPSTVFILTQSVYMLSSGVGWIELFTMYIFGMITMIGT